MLTIAYVRVSTDDQVEHSPDAQRRRCAEYAAQKNLGPVKFLSDEGQSGKDLERPAMQELVGLIEADQVTNLIVWRMDRLSRDSGDTSRLLRLFEQHCVNVHSLNEGDLETGSASGRFTAGLHGLLAQLEREKIIENIHLGNEQAVRTGYWINRAPTGYNAVDRVLVPNDDAHLIRRAFKLRAGGQSYPQIEQGTGLKYSTVRHALENKVYLGFTRLRDEWFPGKHEPLVSQAEFDAAQRAHTPGRRRGKDLLSGRVRCGECGRITGIDTNGRGKPIYRCRTRGKGCAIPGRSAAGLHRAARLGVELLRTDDQLVEAIRTHFAEKTERAGAGTAEPSRAGTLGSLRSKRQKLFDLLLAGKITDDFFAEQEHQLTAKIEATEADRTEAIETHRHHNALAEAFEQAAAMLRDPAFELAEIWDNASAAERRVIVEEFIESVTIYADRLEVNVTGAPPLLVTLAEVGLREPGTAPVVSEGGLELPQRSCCRVPPSCRLSCHCRGSGRVKLHPLPARIAPYRAVSRARDDKVMTSSAEQIATELDPNQVQAARASPDTDCR